MADRVHLLDTMVEAHCARDKCQPMVDIVDHLLDTMVEAHCDRDKGTNASQWLIEFTTYWTLRLEPTVNETKGLLPANG